MKSSYYVLGTMSGTSLDGLDLAFCYFTKTDAGWDYHVIAAATFPYDEALRERLSDAIGLSAYEFVKLDVDLARTMAHTINKFLSVQEIRPDFIASHGHTTFHQPAIGLTSQIGSGAVLAAHTGITTVCDFRTVDVALGGQGAPLVPIGDELLFSQYDACLNLGGFSNISFRQDGKRVACDISPCNMALNYLAAQLGMPYDHNGETARKGTIDENLLNTLNNLDFYQQKGAKSLGKEWFDTTFRPLLDASERPVSDKLRTLTEHIAMQLAASSQDKTDESNGKFPKTPNDAVSKDRAIAEACTLSNDANDDNNSKTMLVTGGGARNLFLIERLKALGTKEVIIPDSQTIDFKEAIIFAFLGVLRMRGEANCLRDVTGARFNNCGGAVYM